MISQAKVVVTTDSSGDATAYSVPFSGVIKSITYLKTDFADGVDFDISTETTLQELWDDDDINASETVHPAVPINNGVGAAITYNGTQGVYHQVAVYEERVKIIVASGGATKTGTFLINYEY